MERLFSSRMTGISKQEEEIPAQAIQFRLVNQYSTTIATPEFMLGVHCFIVDRINRGYHTFHSPELAQKYLDNLVKYPVQIVEEVHDNKKSYRSIVHKADLGSDWKWLAYRGWRELCNWLPQLEIK